MDFPLYFKIMLGQWEGVILDMQYGLFRVFSQFLPKLDGVGPVDNRPSTNQLHHFVQ